MEEIEDSERIGALVRNVRAYRDVSQSQLAKDLGISKQKASAMEAEGRGLTRATIQLLVDKYRIDARYFFGQLTSVEEADLDKRSGDSKLSPIERVEAEVKAIRKAQKPVMDLDPVVQRVEQDGELYELVRQVRFWDATMVRRLRDIAIGLEAGKNLRDDHEPQREVAG